MKSKYVILIWLFVLSVIVASANSHPDSKNNGKDSPRFYASPKAHPEHP